MGCNNIIWLIGTLFGMLLMLAVAWCLAPWNKKGSRAQSGMYRHPWSQFAHFGGGSLGKGGC